VNSLGILVLILVVAICVSAVVRLVTALFSEHICTSVWRHPMAHGILFAVCIACLFVPRISSGATQASITAIRTDFSNIRSALDAYAIDCGHYPTTEEGLKALMNPPTNVTNWHGSYCYKFPQDLWKHDYGYRYPGLHNTNDIDLYSCGFDGISKSGGEDPDDINNWDKSSPHDGRNVGYMNKFEQIKASPLFTLSLIVILFLNNACLIAAIFSKRVRASIAPHPTAYNLWLALSVLSVGLFVFFCVPRLSGR